MSTYIVKADYGPRIRDRHIAQLTDTNDLLLDSAEDTAIQVIKDALHSRYDVDAIFAKTDATRDKQVVEWVINLSMYYLYRRLPDKFMTENVTTDYDNTLELLKDLEDGKRSSQLPRIQNEEGENKTKFRWGSQPPKLQ